MLCRLEKNQFGKMTSSDNGVMYDLDVPPEIINGRTLVPARAVAEALDCSVNWDGNTQTVTISSEKWIDGANSPTNAYIHNGVVYYSFIYADLRRCGNAFSVYLHPPFGDRPRRFRARRKTVEREIFVQPHHCSLPRT